MSRHDDDVSRSVIAVIGTGSASAPPDRCVIQLGVQITQRTVAEASEQANLAAQRLLQSLESMGVNRLDIRSNRLSLHPELDHRSGRGVPVGYTARHSFAAIVRDIEQVPMVLDAAIRSAGDAGTVDGITFGHEDTAPLERRARHQAFADAHDKARQLAELAGVQLGAAISIAESRPGGRPPVPGMARTLAAVERDSGPPVAFGDQEVTVNLSIEFALG